MARSRRRRRDGCRVLIRETRGTRRRPWVCLVLAWNTACARGAIGTCVPRETYTVCQFAATGNRGGVGRAGAFDTRRTPRPNLALCAYPTRVSVEPRDANAVNNLVASRRRG